MCCYLVLYFHKKEKVPLWMYDNYVFLCYSLLLIVLLSVADVTEIMIMMIIVMSVRL